MTIEKIIVPYTRAIWSSCMVNIEKISSNEMAEHIERIESELCEKINKWAYNKALECLPEKQNPITNDWGFGYDACIDEMKANLKKAFE